MKVLRDYLQMNPNLNLFQKFKENDKDKKGSLPAEMFYLELK